MQVQGRSDSQKAVVAQNPLLGAASLSGEPKDLIGSVVGQKYRLLEHLGSGGMADVFVAEHLEISKHVALKLIRHQLAAHSDARQRFLREAKATSYIDHDNVVSVLDFGEIGGGGVFLVMELLKGEPLGATLAREGPFSAHRAKTIALQICRALHAAHEKGVVHRDIKPENCFRSKRGANADFIKVIDFGLAKLVGNENRPEESLTESGTIFGTPEYMSPEQCRGRHVDARTDIYALGVLLYEMLTGVRPFTGSNLIQVLTKQATEAPTPPSQLHGVPRIHPAMESLILRALEKDPDKRFQSMRELAEALASLPGPTEAAIPRADLPEATTTAAPPPGGGLSRGFLFGLVVAQTVVILALVILLLSQ